MKINDLKIDRTCVPYPKKGIYWLVTLPYLIVLIGVTAYLWSYNMSVAITYFSLYLISTLLHGYVCSFSECPYKGTFCPGAFGWFPVGKIAGKLKKPEKRNDKVTGILFLFIMLCTLGILAIPVYWINKLGITSSIGYVFLVLLHFFSFVIFVCPKCAGRGNCPTAKLSDSLNKRLFNKGIL